MSMNDEEYIKAVTSDCVTAGDHHTDMLLDAARKQGVMVAIAFKRNRVELIRDEISDLEDQVKFLNSKIVKKQTDLAYVEDAVDVLKRSIGIDC